MGLNTVVLEKHGIDYEHGFKQYLGCAYQFNNALLSAFRNPIFNKVECEYMRKRRGGLYVCAKELKSLSDNLGMAEVYESASVMMELLHNVAYAEAMVDAAYIQMKAAISAALDGIRASITA